MVNLSGRTVDVPAASAALLPDTLDESAIVIGTYDAAHAVASLASRELAAWEGVVVKL